MAFLAPAHLIPVPLQYNGSVDNVTDRVMGWQRFDGKIFYVDFLLHDANDTFDDTTLTLEFDDGASGADSVIVAHATGAVTAQEVGNYTLDDLTTSVIDAGSRYLLTISNPSTGADLGVTITVWVAPVNIN